MSEDFKNLTGPQVADEIDRLNAVLDRNQHNPAQLTKRVENIQGDVVANRLNAANVALTDALETLAVSLGAAGELGTALGAAGTGGEFFTVAGANDTSDDALAGAKGSAPEAGDAFYVVSPSAVKFVGQV